MAGDAPQPYWDEDARRWMIGTAGALPPPPTTAPPATPAAAPPAAPSTPPLTPPLAAPLTPPPASPLAPPPAPVRWRLPRGRAAVAAASATVLLAVAIGTALALYGSDDDPGAETPAAGSSGPRPSTGPTQPTQPADGVPTDPGDPTPSLSPSVSGPPPGFTRLRDPVGFTLDVPEGWERRTEDVSVFYEEPDGPGVVQAFPLDGPEQSPYEALEVADELLAKNNKGYERHGLSRRGPDSATLLYSYDSEDAGERLRVIDEVFVAEDGEMYALLVGGPEADWPDQESVHATVRAAFCPESHCPAGSGGEGPDNAY